MIEQRQETLKQELERVITEIQFGSHTFKGEELLPLLENLWKAISLQERQLPVLNAIYRNGYNDPEVSSMYFSEIWHELGNVVTIASHRAYQGYYSNGRQDLETEKEIT